MRTLAKIVVGGFLAFQLLAIADEWELFSSAWFSGGDQPPAPELSEADREEAVAAVRLTLEIMRHLYLSAGDPRFAERLPASPAVREELVADAEYLATNHRLQDPRLEEFEVVEIEVLDEDRVRLLTRESWLFRIVWITGQNEAEPARRQSLAGTYSLARRDGEWRVENWSSGAPAVPEIEP